MTFFRDPWCWLMVTLTAMVLWLGCSLVGEPVTPWTAIAAQCPTADGPAQACQLAVRYAEQVCQGQEPAVEAWQYLRDTCRGADPEAQQACLLVVTAVEHECMLMARE